MTICESALLAACVLVGEIAFEPCPDSTAFASGDALGPSRIPGGLEEPVCAFLDLQVIDPAALVACGFDGVRIVNLAAPGGPFVVAVIETRDRASGVAVVGDLALIADGYAGLAVIDLGDPYQPAEIARVDTPGFAASVAAVGSTALVADGYRGLRCVDFTDPASPVDCGSLELPGWAGSAAVAGSMAVVATGVGGLRVIDVGVASAMVETAVIEIPGAALGVTIHGETIWVKNDRSEICSVDLPAPGLPVMIDCVDLSVRPRARDDDKDLGVEFWIDALVFGGAAADE